ncbi:hypothetical protein DOJK_02168 [Patescibacteria group bacterium]|nr:hypothetical protein DOJK_02168 [Patescibacteria group bacterium]
MLKQWFSKFFDKKTTQPVDLYCPLCDSHPTDFLPLPDYYPTMWQRHQFPYSNDWEMTPLDTYSCPNCGASDRERLYAFWIKQYIQQKHFTNNVRLIHFAPEISLANWLKKSATFNYSSADLFMPEADFKVDITAMPFENESIDFFICSHVLEHVDSDDKAMRELYRILKTNGCGILMVPIIVGLTNTLEDINITDEAERWRLFGQDDHVRLYAHDDYIKKLQKHGFIVEQLNQDYFGASVFQSLGLKSTSILYIVRRHDKL